MRFQPTLRSSALRAPLLAVAALAVGGAAGLHAALPYTQATVTRLQNRVSYGDAPTRATRPAKPADIIRAQSYLLTETDARAELRYEDGTLVRIGQNTVFTFEADTRTLSLEKGSLVFHIPKGSGGGTIRTASITAAITGTSGKLSENMIAILEGEVTLVPSGKKVPAGFFARANPNGTISVLRFDPAKAGDGKLMNFNGPLPGFDENRFFSAPAGPLPLIPQLNDSFDRTQNNPSTIDRFFPDVVNPRTRIPVPPRHGGGGGERPPPY